MGECEVWEESEAGGKRAGCEAWVICADERAREECKAQQTARTGAAGVSSRSGGRERPAHGVDGSMLASTVDLASHT